MHRYLLTTLIVVSVPAFAVMKKPSALCLLQMQTQPKPLRINYAHPLSVYDTPQEARDMQSIKVLFPGAEIINPNGHEHDAAYKEQGMQYFKDICDQVDVCVFRAFPDGSIPAGVATEIEQVQSNGGVVIELPSATLRRSLNKDETRAFLRESGYR